MILMLRVIYKKIQQIVLMSIFRLLPIKKNRILFMSYYGKHVNCNPYAIFQYMQEEMLPYEYIWVDNSLSHSGYNTKCVKFRSLQFYLYLCTAKFLVFNARPNIDIKKRSEQKYIQTWHGSLPLKMIEKDAADTLSRKYVVRAEKDSKYIDVLISGNRFNTDCFRRTFWYNGVILDIGNPRNDIFFSDQKDMIRIKTKQQLNIKQNEKICLYAPTFRNSTDISYLEAFDAKIFSKILKRNLGGEWKILLRLHPNVVTNSNAVEHGFVDSSAYPDMQALLIASDMLITDYSSSMFDFLLLDKPCLLFCPDYSDYIKNNRKLYFDISKLPFPLAQSFTELTEYIDNFNMYKYQNDIDDFKNEVGIFENGSASKKATDYIKENT